MDPLGSKKEFTQLKQDETSKVGAISKTQKAQNIFEKILEIFENFFFRKMSHCAEKCKGGPFLIYKHAFCCKITKKLKEGPFGDIKKIFEKSHSAEKCKGGPFLIYKHAFCCKITKNSKRDPLGTFKNFRKVAQCRKKIKKGTL